MPVFRFTKRVAELVGAEAATGELGAREHLLHLVADAVVSQRLVWMPERDEERALARRVNGEPRGDRFGQALGDREHPFALPLAEDTELEVHQKQIVDRQPGQFDGAHPCVVEALDERRGAQLLGGASPISTSTTFRTAATWALFR